MTKPTKKPVRKTAPKASKTAPRQDVSQAAKSMIDRIAARTEGNDKTQNTTAVNPGN